jgi:FkbM family methyltransferase
MSYSQNQEEKYILEFFKGKTGTLLDIGANDGVTFSNSRALIEREWVADLVEPSPKAFERLEVLYEGNKNVYLWNCAISNQSGHAFLLESGSLIDKGDTSLVSSLKKDETVRWKKVDFVKVEVETCTINDLSAYSDIPNWDFISIDAEGYDLEILRQIDLTNTQLLCIEWNSVDVLRKSILEYTSKFNMNKILYTSGENLLLCRKQ